MLPTLVLDHVDASGRHQGRQGEQQGQSGGESHGCVAGEVGACREAEAKREQGQSRLAQAPVATACRRHRQAEAGHREHPQDRQQQLEVAPGEVIRKARAHRQVDPGQRRHVDEPG